VIDYLVAFIWFLSSHG